MFFFLLLQIYSVVSFRYYVKWFCLLAVVISCWTQWRSLLACLTRRVMSFCQHLVSSICPLSVNFSHFNLLLWNYMANWNHTLQEWCLEIKSSTKKSSFRFNLPKNMAATSILDSDWLIYKKSSILKLHGQLESIFAGIMLEGHLQKKLFVLILQRTQLIQAVLFLIGQYTKKCFLLKLLCQLEPNIIWMMLRWSSTKIPHFILIKQKHAQIRHSYFWLANIHVQKICFL